MWCKMLSLSVFVALLLPISGARAQCPKQLDSIKLNRIRTGNTFTVGGYEYREGQRENTTTFDHNKLWALMGKNNANYTVTLLQDIGTRPGVAACTYQVKENSQDVTKLLLHGDKR